MPNVTAIEIEVDLAGTDVDRLVFEVAHGGVRLGDSRPLPQPPATIAGKQTLVVYLDDALAGETVTCHVDGFKGGDGPPLFSRDGTAVVALNEVVPCPTSARDGGMDAMRDVLDAPVDPEDALPPPLDASAEDVSRDLPAEPPAESPPERAAEVAAPEVAPPDLPPEPPIDFAPPDVPPEIADEPPPDVPPPDGPHTCGKAADCVGDDLGRVCLGGVCQSCAAALQCVAQYGSGYKCDKGTCTMDPTCSSDGTWCSPGVICCNATCVIGNCCTDSECAIGCGCFSNLCAQGSGTGGSCR